MPWIACPALKALALQSHQNLIRLALEVTERTRSGRPPGSGHSVSSRAAAVPGRNRRASGSVTPSKHSFSQRILGSLGLGMGRNSSGPVPDTQQLQGPGEVGECWARGEGEVQRILEM